MFFRLTQQIVALKETRLKEDEGAPFTAIREGEKSSVLLTTLMFGVSVTLTIDCVSFV